MGGEQDPRVLVLAELRKQTALLERILSALAPAPSVDPVVKTKDPRDWSGAPMNGRKFSECPAEYLDLVASRAEHFLTKPGQDEKQIGYSRRDASAARAWAARIRAGFASPVTAAPATMPEDDFAQGAEPRW